MTNKDLTSFREEYSRGELDEHQAGKDPFLLFNLWLDEAIHQGLPEPNAMTLATVTEEGHPAARVVLLKEFNEKGFVFYTNYQSQKGVELQANPNAALVMMWLALQRQVRISGRVEKLPAEKADAYFRSRPRNSQISALVSPQSQPIEGRETLEQQFQRYQFSETEIQRPENWGGYLVIPGQFEFWQGRESRLHDRLLYSLTADGWVLQRLAP